MSVYEKLNVRKVINASFCLTVLGGSKLPQETLDAMLTANESFVEIADLEEKAGKILSKITGAEAAFVTSGAYSAFALASAACIAGSDPEKMMKLPHTDGMKNEILIQANLRSIFDRSIQTPGGVIVEVGTKEHGCTEEEFEEAINKKTAAIHYIPALDPPRSDVLSLEKVVEIGHRKGIPIIVDAAGQTYPLERVSMFTKIGADLVCYSGKYFQGPNSTGFVCGRKDLVESVKANSFIGPGGCKIGRGYKLDRQEIVALLAAVERWMNLDHEKVRFKPARAKQRYIIDFLTKISEVQAESQPYSYHTMGVVITFDKTAEETAELVQKLRNGDPAIWLRRRRENSVLLNTLFLDIGDEKIIVDRLKELLL
jgi:L-seryl-tRNA(Ser) seleniumtransferase